ncbi:MAG TPA: UDP-N-acetylmuramate--L-alanine ligase [Candidatus Methylacidiphilales bacterium]|nr:UDP-N-acetylmuramate--L-alanine ligase [Candidatus Methylacidiphilales bacterium]
MQPELKQRLEELLKSAPQKIHLIGICGSGMSGLARLLLALGHELSGSDLVPAEQAASSLPPSVRYFKGHKASQVTDATLIVFSSAIAVENPERKAAMQRGVVCVRRAECLVVLAEMKSAYIVAGSHGKTTTSSMLTHVLRQAGRKPSHYIGAQVPLLGANAAWTEGQPFVIEADESDGTLALFAPQASLILNIEEEHLDFYHNIEEIVEVFATLCERTRGPIVYCADDKNAMLLCSHCAQAVSYGRSELAVYRALDVRLQSFSSRFTVLHKGQLLGEIALEVPGAQNVSDALGVVALATELGIPWNQIATALAEFRGASRRFEVKYRSANYMVVDDYAHHPTEIKATLAAARNSGWKRVLALFQPHRYSRTKALLGEFAKAFHDATEVFITEIYAASEPAMAGVTGEAVAEMARANGHGKVHYEATLGRLRAAVNAILEPGDLVITLGAGDIHRVALHLAQGLNWQAELSLQLKPGSVFKRDEPLHKHTTMRIGGPAQLWFEPVDEEDLQRGLRFAHDRGIPVTFIGRGSNLLVRDGGILGLCIHLGQPCFNRIEVEGEYVTAGAGVRLKQIVAEARKHNLGGFEFMEGIPGNLGGALRMNAGAMQGWTMEVVESVRSIDMLGQIHEVRKTDMEIHYRSVPHFQNHIAVSARLKGTPSAKHEINEKLKTFSNKRWTSQPAAPSAGCIFKNPGPIPAGQLIDELGLKNLSVGPARVSEVHGNFIVNDGGATAGDVLQLISMIQERAREARQIDLHTEVIVLGEEN